MRFLIVFLLAIATCSAQDAAAARDDYRAGRYAAAYEAFARELAAAGPRASDELRWNAALAALRLQRFSDAAAAIEPLLTAPEMARRADAEFVLAMSQFQRGELAAAAAQLPDAEPLAWTMALRAMQQARDGFLRAAELRGDWPVALRNAERAALQMGEYEQKRARQAEAKAKQETVDPPPQEPPKPAAEPEPEPAAPTPVVDRLSPAELAALLERGQQRDRLKRRERQAAQRASARVGERDW